MADALKTLTAEESCDAMRSPVLARRSASGISWLWVSVLVVVLDQLSKYLCTVYLAYGEVIPVFPGVNLTLLHNTGAAFSFLNQAGGWQRWLFIGLALLVSLVILIWLYRLRRERAWLAVALALILGGAAGNLWDRMYLGYVIDFIQVYYKYWYWPAINIADSAIFVGAVMLLIDAFRGSE